MNFVIGADEVGYGALSGPLVVCGVRANDSWTMAGLKDSKKFKNNKKLTAHEQRRLISDKLHQEDDICFHIAERTNKQIDSVGVATALKDCYVEIFKALYSPGDRIITDGILNFSSYNLSFKVESIVKADDKFTTVMAASIIAKSFRDNKMHNFHQQYPNYNWIKNVGYASKDHLEAIHKYGPCDLHRFSYDPMKSM